MWEVWPLESDSVEQGRHKNFSCHVGMALLVLKSGGDSVLAIRTVCV